MRERRVAGGEDPLGRHLGAGLLLHGVLHVDVAEHTEACGLDQPLVTAMLAVPILIQVFFNSGLAYWLNRRPGESHSVACPPALIGAHPILMNRPIGVTPLGTRLCRPSEAVLDILPSPQRAAFAKEDGEPVIDATKLERSRRVAS